MEDVQIVDQIKGKIDEKINPLTEKVNGIETKAAKIEGLENDLVSLKEAAKANALALKEMELRGKSPFSMLSDELSGAIKQMSENFTKGKFDERISVKSVGDMLTSSNVTGTGAQPQMLTPMGEIRLPMPLAFDLCNVFRTSEGIITDVSQDSEEGGAARTTEGSAKEQYDFNVYGTQYTVLPVNAYVTITRNMLYNLPYLENFIRNRLLKKVLDKASSQIFEGSGSTPIMKGISEFATAWSAGSWATSIVNPTLYHCLIIGVAQARANNYEPNAILLHPSDAAGLRLAVIDKQINMPEAIISNGRMFVSGVPVYETSHVTSDKYYIGEMKLSNVAIQKDFELFVDPYSGLKTNKITILGEMFLTHFVQKCDTGAFIKGDISDDITALTSV